MRDSFDARSINSDHGPYCFCGGVIKGRTTVNECDQWGYKLIESLLKTPPTVPAVREALRLAMTQLPKSTAPSVCVDALLLRTRLGDDPQIITRELIAELARSHGDVSEFSSKVMALVKELGPGAAPALRDSLDQWITTLPDESIGSATYKLAQVGPDAVPFLIQLLNDERPYVRYSACYALEKLGPQAGEAVDALIERLDDDAQAREQYPDPVWIFAAYALGKIGPSASPALPKLWERLSDPQQHAASTVLGTVERIGGPADEMLLRIQPYFHHRNTSLHGVAVRIAIRTAPARPETQQLVDDYIRRLRYEGLRDDGFINIAWINVEALAQTLIEEPAVGRGAIPQLQLLFDSRFLDRKSRCEIAIALVKLDPQNPQPLEYLQRLSRQRDFDHRYDGKQALEKLGTPKADI